MLALNRSPMSSEQSDRQTEGLRFTRFSVEFPQHMNVP
jgi:hypothetical protein